MFLRTFSIPFMLALSCAPILHAQVQTRMMVQSQTVAVPDFTGKTLQQAQTAAVVPNSTQPLFLGIYPNGSTGGVVVSQTPVAHTPVIPGTTRLLLTLDTPKPSPLQAIFDQILSQRKKAVRVPQLQGDTHTVASRLLEAAHLQGSFIGDTRGVVVQQFPPAGKSVDPGSTILVTLDVPQVVVPVLYGMTLLEATRRLEQSSLQRGQVYGDNPAGTVSSQFVAAGTQVPPGTVVSVTMTPVSVTRTPPPPPPVVVPALAKMSRSEAVATLASVGLRGRKTKGPSTGFVSDQTPMGGTVIEPGTTVEFELKARMIVVPDVVRDTPVAAVESLDVFGLHSRISYAAISGVKATQVVAEQRPSAGTNVEAGSTIDLVVKDLPPPRPWGWVWAGVLSTVVAIVVILFLWPSPPPPATCTLVASNTVPNIKVGKYDEPGVRFAIGLRDSASAPQYRLNKEPVVTKKG